MKDKMGARISLHHSPFTTWHANISLLQEPLAPFQRKNAGLRHSPSSETEKRPRPRPQARKLARISFQNPNLNVDLFVVVLGL